MAGRMKKKYLLIIRGKRREWGFEVEVDPKYINDWRDDGIIIDEIENIIPLWWVEFGLPPSLWCFVQDVLNFKNPFS